MATISSGRFTVWQRQDAVGPAARAAGSRRRLHQERARRVQRLGARGVVVGQAFFFRHLGVLVVQVQPQERQGVAVFQVVATMSHVGGHARGVFVGQRLDRLAPALADLGPGQPSKYLLSSASVTPAMPRSTSARPCAATCPHGSAPAPARPPRRRRRQPARRHRTAVARAGRVRRLGGGRGRAGLKSTMTLRPSSSASMRSSRSLSISAPRCHCWSFSTCATEQQAGARLQVQPVGEHAPRARIPAS